ncbi:MAG: CoA-binding protein [Ilumatobacter sp.]|uniref:CoA-binding protein n=1 Tax=Ilumatobacter sp. TaxID=1967498 RepID=UPI002638169F|nr:CoA-binding protein [Ilumatobacter sp.]MDJ0768881.1 CoA-binding protein [Ilumatobacter sp.]
MTILERASERLALMQRTRTVAIVGMSANPSRASHFVATYLAGKAPWTVYYVNPREHEVLGQPVYPSLDALPDVPDLVDVFRRVDDLPSVVDEAVDVGAGAVWFQLGLRHDDAATVASAAGLDVVQNRCLKIEHARFAGGLHTAGFVTGVIDSRRGRLI